jgi:hypothetical protein
MSELKSTYEIKYPQQTTYFIAYTNNLIFAYGIVTSQQEMTTGQPILWTTLDESEWIDELKNVYNVNMNNVDQLNELERIEYTPFDEIN